jgi:hypothetical protein
MPYLFRIIQRCPLGNRHGPEIVIGVRWNL